MEFSYTAIKQKLIRANGILSKLRHNVPIEACLQVYYAIFYSHLIYGCNVWGLTTEEHFKKIEILQKKCVRIMSFSDFNSHTNQLFMDLKLLKVRNIIDLQHLNLVYDFYDNRLPIDLKKSFTFSSDIHITNIELNSTRKNFIHIPRTKAVMAKNQSNFIV